MNVWLNVRYTFRVFHKLQRTEGELHQTGGQFTPLQAVYTYDFVYDSVYESGYDLLPKVSHQSILEKCVDGL